MNLERSMYTLLVHPKLNRIVKPLSLLSTFNKAIQNERKSWIDLGSTSKLELDIDAIVLLQASKEDDNY